MLSSFIKNGCALSQLIHFLAHWKPEEIEIFDHIFQKYGKTYLWFVVVKEKLGGSKTLAEIIHYYYLTKKIPRPVINNNTKAHGWEKRNAKFLGEFSL
jgi:hypothetical protein